MHYFTFVCVAHLGLGAAYPPERAPCPGQMDAHRDTGVSTAGVSGHLPAIPNRGRSPVAQLPGLFCEGLHGGRGNGTPVQLHRPARVSTSFGSLGDTPVALVSLLFVIGSHCTSLPATPHSDPSLPGERKPWEGQGCVAVLNLSSGGGPSRSERTPGERPTTRSPSRLHLKLRSETRSAARTLGLQR